MTLRLQRLSALVRQWLWDVGWWDAPALDEWSWHPRLFRARFWRTPTNALHRAHHEVHRDTIRSAIQQIQAAYAQGLRDGAFQYAELVRSRDTRQSPSSWYVQ